jgi:hypothetical protein
MFASRGAQGVRKLRMAAKPLNPIVFQFRVNPGESSGHLRERQRSRRERFRRESPAGCADLRVLGPPRGSWEAGAVNIS